MADDLIIPSEADLGDDAENALIAQTLSVSDLSPASILSVFARAVFAREMSALYLAGLRWQEAVYVQSAAGAALDRRLADFGLTRPAAAKSHGRVTFSRLPEAEGGDPNAAVVIPAGYEVSARDEDGALITFTVRDQVTIVAGTDTAAGLVDCAQTGKVGNVGSGAIDELTGGAVANLKAVTNAYAFTAGRDRGSDEEARATFFAWLDARARTTPAALEYGARTYTELVDPDLPADAPGNLRRPIQSASVVEYLDAPGPDNAAAAVYLWAHSGLDLTDAQVSGVQERIDGYTDAAGQEVDGWRAAGCKVKVERGQYVEVPIRVRLTLAPGANPLVRDRLRQAITTVVGLLDGGETLRVKTVFDQIAAFGTEIANAQIIEPAADVAVAANQKVTPSTVEVT